MDPRTEIEWNILFIGLFNFGFHCAQMAPGVASDAGVFRGARISSLRLWPAGLNWHFGAETDHFNFHCRKPTLLVRARCFSSSLFGRCRDILADTSKAIAVTCGVCVG